MKLSEFARRARASRLEKKAQYDAAFERAMRDLKLAEIPATQSRPSAHTRSESGRPVLTLFPRT